MNENERKLPKNEEIPIFLNKFNKNDSKTSKNG